MIMLLWWIEATIDWNQLLPTIESKNRVAIMIVGNSGKRALTDAADSVAGGAGAGAGAAQGGALGRGVAGPVPAARSRVASLILHEKGHKLGILSLMNTGWSNWIILRKLKYSVCCLRYVIVKMEGTYQTTHRILQYPV